MMRARWMWALVAAVLLQGCGGGDDAEDGDRLELAVVPMPVRAASR
jgi:hypothetical protein